MKKSGLAILVVLIVGCSSQQSTFNDFSGGNTANRTNITQRTPSSRNNATQISALPRRAKSYVLPISYETAYTYRTDTSDPKMRNIPRNIEANRANNPDEYIRQIAGYINENSTNDFERVKKAHDLVALLIRYDAANFWANTVPDQDFRSVLKSKLAVCEGYSNLFKKICDDLQVECEIVHGFGRGVGTSPFAGDTPTNSNHAWNIVTINNENYLVDCTWDSGNMDGRVFKQEYTTDWLFLKSEQFLYSHFPENQNQQLLEKSLSSGEFLKLPFYKPKFFEVVEEIDFNLLATNQVDGKLALEYTVKEGFDISYTIYNENGSRQFSNNTFSQKEGGKYKAYFSFPDRGNYILRIFWKKAGARTGRSCGELGIVSSTGNIVKYPTQFVSSGRNIEIINPIEMPLRGGNSYEFKVRIDNKNVVALIYGRNFIQLKKGEDGIFIVEAEIPSNIKDLSIGIADSERGRYETIVQYQVN